MARYFKTKKGDYLICGTIGKGRYTKVKHGISTNDSTDVAIKMTDAQFSQLTIQEFQLIQHLKHPSIVTIHECSIEGSFSYLIMDKLENDLFDWIEKYENGIPEELMKKVAFEVASALDYAHNKDVVHLDLKPENIMFGNELRAIVIDWGFGANVADNRKLNTFVGSLHYCAPEILLGIPFDGKKADAWSFGVLLFVSLTGMFPWPGNTNIGIRQSILTMHYEWTDKELSEEVKDLIRKLIVLRPKNRLSFQEILKHAWLLP